MRSGRPMRKLTRVLSLVYQRGESRHKPAMKWEQGRLMNITFGKLTFTGFGAPIGEVHLGLGILSDVANAVVVRVGPQRGWN